MATGGTGLNSLGPTCAVPAVRQRYFPNRVPGPAPVGQTLKANNPATARAIFGFLRRSASYGRQVGDGNFLSRRVVLNLVFAEFADPASSRLRGTSQGTAAITGLT